MALQCFWRGDCDRRAAQVNTRYSMLINMAPTQIRAVQSQYLRSLAALQKIFSSQPFLLGSRPTRADFGLMAPFFRHFSSDPTPRKIMQQRAPAVMEWVARMWNCRRSTLPSSTSKSDDPMVSLPKGWEALRPLFKEYLVYLDHNARAWSDGESQFTATFQGVESQVWGDVCFAVS